MAARSYSGANSIPTTTDVFNASSNRAGPESTSMDREHRVGNTVDRVDQLSSVTLLGLAVAGAVVMLALHWVVG